MSLWTGVVHDWTKFTLTEWGPYARNFFNSDGTRRSVRDKTGAYDPNSQNDAFKMAWLSHQRNKHHWQAWISIGDGGRLTALPMPERFVREMLADWTGAGRAISGKHDPLEWYTSNRDKMILNTGTQVFVDHMIGWERARK